MPQEHGVTPGSLTHRVATEIRAELGRQQMSQSKLAEQLGIHQTAVSKRLIGTRYSFTTAELDRIAVILGVPVEQLFGMRALAGAS